MRTAIRSGCLGTLVITALLFLSGRGTAGDFCYRGSAYPVQAAKITTYHAPASYGTAYGHSYAYQQLVPYAVEVQVNKDRYYSLSDLYRDRLYLEAFDLMRDMRQKMNQLSASGAAPGALGGATGGGGPSVTTPPTNPNPPVPQHSPPPNAPPPAQPRGSLNKTSDRALAVLKSACLSCHNADTEKSEKRPNPMSLEDPDAVPAVMRWASFGMAASRDMPKAPKELREKGGQPLSDWKAKHGLKDEELKVLYEEWLPVPPIFNRP